MHNIYNSILVPTDLKERSLAALDESLNLARMTGLEITLFHVMMLLTILIYSSPFME